jgi:predicted alpha/beta-hydrolase family hydrolase
MPASYTITSLSITGYRDLPVSNTFFRQDGAAEHLAVVLPGYGYTADMPVLYYPAALLREMGADVLQVRYAYHQRQDWRGVSAEEQGRWLFADAAAACEVGLAQRSYRRVTLVGKSLGTLAMGHLLATDGRLAAADCAWLTPILSDEALRSQMGRHKGRALIAIGTRDPYYDRAAVDGLRQATGGEVLVAEGADHSLEVAGDIERALDIMRDLMRALRGVLARAG